MKKIYSVMSTAALAALTTVSAQQLPNNGFEEAWSTATPYTSASVPKGKQPITIGENPESWVISHVTGVTASFIWGIGRKDLGSEVAGYNSASAVELKNAETGAMGAYHNVPGYLTTGTTWSTAVATTKTDGGTFGSIPFSSRPDAMSVMYKRTHGTENQENATVVVYMWKGQKVQKDVPAAIIISGTPALIDMIDRDRCVLSVSLDGCQGGDVETSSDFELIAHTTYYIAGDQAEWKELEIPIDYLSNSTPTKFNVIFSANDYFTTTVGLDNTLTVDDVKLLYYSRLASLKVNGADVAGFDPNVYEYDLTSIEMPADASVLEYAALGNSGSAKVTPTVDTENNQILLTVANAQGSDKDGKNEHVYTLKFKAKEPVRPTFPEDETIFEGTLVIEMFGGTINEGDLTNYYVHLKYNDATDSYDLSLPNFWLDLGEGPVALGDINIENVKCTNEANGDILYTGEKKGLVLAGGEIEADVTCNGTETPAGMLKMQIAVSWKMNEENEIPIDVTFNGVRIQTGVESVAAADADAPVEYFDLQGRKLINPTSGLVIRRQGTKVEKVIL